MPAVDFSSKSNPCWATDRHQAQTKNAIQARFYLCVQCSVFKNPMKFERSNL